MQPGDWLYATTYQTMCQVVDVQALWGDTICRIWLPNHNTVVRVPADELKPMGKMTVEQPDHISYVAAATRIADSLSSDMLLAPIESSVIPLPHQIRALSRAVSNERVRYLLADEVGLGKTIEAGLIMRELKLRGRVARTLVVAPKGLVTQWVAEMRTHFNEEFRLLNPSNFAAYRSIVQEENIWGCFPQVVCPMDSVKPIDSRRGWSYEQLAQYNRERYEDLISAGWDLIIVDEAHRLGGSTDQVARYRLGRGLAEAAPYMLLLSATPHQGKSDAFHRLVSLLDKRAFPDLESVTKERVQPYVIRTEKRQAITATGDPLFKPRRTQLEVVAWGDRHRKQRILYDAVTEYVREGYNQAMREKRNYVGFLMILMQRLIASSTRAIRLTLERRLEALETPETQLSLFEDLSPEDWSELDGEEQLEILIKTKLQAIKDERTEVLRLLRYAKECDESGPDVKAEALLDWIYRLQQKEGDPNLKVLIFTEFVATQEMLCQFLIARGFQVACLNGSMDMEERQHAQQMFADSARILVSTDAGGEGLNLQFCHVVINYDIPWNPMRLEQRIGRVDRIGQTNVVRAINFVLEDSVDHRVLEVLEDKLAVIYDEFGVDKTGDVLDSAQAANIFEQLYIEAVLNPESVQMSVDKAVSLIGTHALERRENAQLLVSTEDLDPGVARRMMLHPLPDWVERMTVAFVRSHGGGAEANNGRWHIFWPDGSEDVDVVFTRRDAEKFSTARRLTLENSRVRGLVMNLPRFARGQPIPCIALPGIPRAVSGFWSLWSISVQAEQWNQRRIIPLFLHDDGRVLGPTARRVWDALLSETPVIMGQISGADACSAFDRLSEEAESHGKPLYQELAAEHEACMAQEREKAKYAFEARRRAIKRVGLAEVRQYRLAQLGREEQRCEAEMAPRTSIMPELAPLLMIHVEAGVDDE
ncbi:MAG: DEAD/DEAH box helicase [Bacillota bacterium]|jgi:SNF2 family DNA or RNA helicase